MVVARVVADARPAVLLAVQRDDRLAVRRAGRVLARPVARRVRVDALPMTVNVVPDEMPTAPRPGRDAATTTIVDRVVTPMVPRLVRVVVLTRVNVVLDETLTVPRPAHDAGTTTIVR
ncbi:MAG: hypothetical protein ACO28Q_06270, partial [Ilumatobacteraceae bacterium]